jgi:hypothetical protein
MNSTLVIARENKVLARINSGDSFIDLWDFADRDSCVIIRSGGPHGPRHLEKFRIKSGHLVGACLESDREARPDWATRFLEKAYRDGIPNECKR